MTPQDRSAAALLTMPCEDELHDRMVLRMATRSAIIILSNHECKTMVGQEQRQKFLDEAVKLYNESAGPEVPTERNSLARG